LKESLRSELAEKMPDVRASFEPADIVNEVMSFGSPTPIDIAVRGSNFADNLTFAEKLRSELAKVGTLRDLQFSQSLSYPTVQVNVNRELAGLSGVTPSDVARSLVTATSSSRFVVPNYWPDPKTGVGYQVQVEVPQAATHSMADLAAIPIRPAATGELLLRDVANVGPSTMPGQYDRYNMKRQTAGGEFSVMETGAGDRFHRAGGSGGSRANALAHRHNAKYPVVQRHDHGHRRGHGQWDSTGNVCRIAAPRGCRGRPRSRSGVRNRRRRRRFAPPASNPDDVCCNDRRNVADGLRLG
jgi:hypothetical protein